MQQRLDAIHNHVRHVHILAEDVFSLDTSPDVLKAIFHGCDALPQPLVRRHPRESPSDVSIMNFIGLCAPHRLPLSVLVNPKARAVLSLIGIPASVRWV